MNEESPPDVAVSTKVHKVKIDDSFKDDALEKVRALVAGNGIEPEELTLSSFEGELLHFEAHTDLVIVTKFSKKTMPGRMTGPINVANEVALQEAISKDYMLLFADADTQRKIREIAFNREDQGFGAQDIHLQIPFWKKEYVIFEPCQTCRTTGKVTCRGCAGKGTISCNRCTGSGTTYCSHCQGAKMVAGPNGNKIQCGVCYGRGRMSCNQCHQTGKMSCRTCAQKGATACPNCQGHAWASNMTIVNIEAKTKFHYPSEELPEKICAMIEEYGDKIREHAKIHIMQSRTNALKEKEAEELSLEELKEKQQILHIPIFYEVSLPYGHIEFDIHGTSYYTFLFGIKGALSHVSPFLDDLLKNGLRKLQDAVEGRGDISQNLKSAATYRTLRRGIYYAGAHSKRKAAKLLERDFPMGLTKATIDTIIENADSALKLLSHKPRQVGLALSCAFMFALFLAYHASPIGKILASKLTQHHMLDLIDAIILAGGVYLGSVIIQAYANKSVTTLMQDIIKSKKPINISAKLGNTALWNIAAGLVAFLIATEISLQIGLHVPQWYALLRG